MTDYFEAGFFNPERWQRFLWDWYALEHHVSEREKISFPAPNYNVAEKLALVHSEISEALEAYRKNLMDDHLPHRKGIEVELADAIIRIMGIAKRLNLNVAGAILEKAAYNDTRFDHTKAVRESEHGKRF